MFGAILPDLGVSLLKFPSLAHRCAACTGKLLKYHMEPFQIISSESWAVLSAVMSAGGKKIKTPVQVKDAKSPQPMLIYKLRSHPKTPCFLSSCTCSKCVRCIFHIDVYQVAEMLSRWSREGRVVVGCGPWPSTTASIPPFPPPPPTLPPFIILIIQILFSEMWELILLSFSANEVTARNTG